MRKLHLFLFAIIISVTSYGQYFEGKINYVISYKSKIPNLTDEQLTSMMGARQEYFIKDGNYKSSTNGTLSGWLLYINKENRLYNKMASTEEVTWSDGANNDDEVLSAKVNKGVTEILGHTCDELILTCKSGIQKYYFNSVLAVDVDLFAKHHYGNWFAFLSNSKSLPLKMTIDMAQFSLETIATEITPLKLETALFELPVGIKIIKSPF